LILAAEGCHSIRLFLTQDIESLQHNAGSHKFHLSRFCWQHFDGLVSMGLLKSIMCIIRILWFSGSLDVVLIVGQEAAKMLM